HVEVRLPLGGEVLADRLVEGARVVRVDQVLDLRAVRVPLLVKLLGLCLVENGPRVGVVAEVALQALCDHASGGLDARGSLGSCDIDELVAVDREAERLPAEFARFAAERAGQRAVRRRLPWSLA